MTLGESRDLFKPQFPHLQSEALSDRVSGGERALQTVQCSGLDGLMSVGTPAGFFWLPLSACQVPSPAPGAGPAGTKHVLKEEMNDYQLLSFIPLPSNPNPLETQESGLLKRTGVVKSERDGGPPGA